MQFALLCAITNLTVAISNKTPVKLSARSGELGPLQSFCFCAGHPS